MRFDGFDAPQQRLNGVMAHTGKTIAYHLQPIKIIDRIHMSDDEIWTTLHRLVGKNEQEAACLRKKTILATTAIDLEI